MQTIQFDTPIEVSKDAYNHLMTNFSGIVAGQISNVTDEKTNLVNTVYLIKVWLMKYVESVKMIIEKYPL